MNEFCVNGFKITVTPKPPFEAIGYTGPVKLDGCSIRLFIKQLTESGKLGKLAATLQPAAQVWVCLSDEGYEGFDCRCTVCVEKTEQHSFSQFEAGELFTLHVPASEWADFELDEEQNPADLHRTGVYGMVGEIGYQFNGEVGLHFDNEHEWEPGRTMHFLLPVIPSQGLPRGTQLWVESPSRKAFVMKTLIENVIPYPLDCEVRLGSIMASLLTSQKRDLSDEPALCQSSGEPCLRCGKCRGWTLREQYYWGLTNEYAFVSGQPLLQFDMSGQDAESRDEMQMLAREGDCLDFMLGYAGYEYRTVEAAAGKEAVFAAVRDSLDRGMPVLLQYKVDELWLLVTGYDDTGALYGYEGGSYEGYCQRMTPAPDRYGGKLFQTTNWHEAMARAVIVGDKCPPRVSLDDAIARNAALMEPIFEHDYYGRAAQYILDEGNYRDEGDNLRRQAKLIDDFIGGPIIGRSIVSWFPFDQLDNNGGDKCRKTLERVRDWCCDIHEICWVAWRGIGRYEPQPERFHAKLTDPLYRKMLAGVVLLIGMVDRHVYEALRAYAEEAQAT